LAIEGEQSTDFEIPCCDIETVSEICPIGEVTAHLPVLVAVVDDEEVATLLRRLLSHKGQLLVLLHGKEHSTALSIGLAVKAQCPLTAKNARIGLVAVPIDG
jgi:hypothetical protein